MTASHHRPGDVVPAEPNDMSCTPGRIMMDSSTTVRPVGYCRDGLRFGTQVRARKRSPNGGVVMAMYRTGLPQLGGGLYLTDAGLETDLIFNNGIEIREFAAHTLLDRRDEGDKPLADYFRGFLGWPARSVPASCSTVRPGRPILIGPTNCKRAKPTSSEPTGTRSRSSRGFVPSSATMPRRSSSTASSALAVTPTHPRSPSPRPKPRSTTPARSDGSQTPMSTW